MTEEQFKEFAERIVSEDVTRPSLHNAFRWNEYSVVTDGRIALVVNRAFESLPEASVEQKTIAASLVERMIPDIEHKLSVGKYDKFDLDVELLVRAAAAVVEDLAPDMAKLRHHEADPDDPDDVDCEDSDRYVYQTYTNVIMPDRKRTVVSGYNARLVADICHRCGPVTACADQKQAKNTLCFRGDDWTVLLQPLYLRDGNEYWIEHNAIADARIGKLVWSRSFEGACNIRKLRFSRPDFIIIDDPQPKESKGVKT